jgi:hypothetical protein
MKLYTDVPHNVPTLHSQTELSQLSDEEFNALFEILHPSIPMRLYRGLCFLLFFGPLKALIVGLSFLLFFIVISILPIFRRFFRTDRAFRTWANRVVRPIIRFGLFVLGIIKIKVNGKLHPDTRTIVSNHMTLIEAVILLENFAVSYLAADWLAEIGLVKQTAKVFDFVFVNRAKRQNGVESLVAMANDPSLLPVVVFPEGKVSNGDAVLAFRSGAYVSPSLVQAVTVRYRMWLTPRSMATFAWNDYNFKRYCYQLFCIPFTTVEVDVLEPISWKGQDKTPQEKAIESQIQIANHLGTIATCRSNKELFAKGDTWMHKKKDE